MEFFDICKLIKSTDNVTIEAINDFTGSEYFAGGIEITIENISINGEKFKHSCDLFSLFDGNYNDWSEAREFFLSDFLLAGDLDEELHEYNISEDSELYNQIKDIIIKSNRYIVSQIEAIADSNNIDLDIYFLTDDDIDLEYE